MHVHYKGIESIKLNELHRNTELVVFQYKHGVLSGNDLTSFESNQYRYVFFQRKRQIDRRQYIF